MIKKINKMARMNFKIIAVLFGIIVTFFIAETIAINSASFNTTNIIAWDDSDSTAKYTQCSNFCSEKIKSSNLWIVNFYANYTDEFYAPINASASNGNCSVRFNETGSWTGWYPMAYNGSYPLWEYNKSFGYKGNFSFQVNCSSNYGNITVFDGVEITNTQPYIIKTAAGYIDFDGDHVKDTLQCTEDILCYYNFSSNVSEDDLNDILAFNYSTSANTTLSNFTLNSATGMLRINITLDANTGNKKIELNVRDTESTTQSGILEVDITAVNDQPVFINLENRTFNMSAVFENVVNVIDEENNIPFVLTINFTSCSLAQWSTRGNNCTLFTGSQYAFNGTTGVLNISFTPSRNDVGSYIINFSVMDNSSLGNKTTSKIINFTVLNIDSAPYFRYVCDNERNATEDYVFSCWINATDIDEVSNLTFVANFSWFKFNNSGTNSTIVACNSSTSYNASALVNFTPTDLSVGNWSIAITVWDLGLGQEAAKSNSTSIWFFVNNTEDNVSLNPISNYTLYENTTVYIYARDDDLLVPDKSVKNESLAFASNTSWASVSSYSSSAKIEFDYNYVYGTYGNGNYSVRINVTDTAGNFAERSFVLNVMGDNAAVWNSSISKVFAIYENNGTYLNLSLNVTDPNGDTLTFSFANDSSFPRFNLGAQTGEINFTPDDSDVGYHNVTVNASDSKLNSLISFNFTVYNINDNPHIETPIKSADLVNASVDSYSNVNCSEDSYVLLSFWAQDEDFKITQKNYYNESSVINVTINGPNTTLLNFIKNSAFGPMPGSNRSKFEAVFIPKKSDVGNYSVTINLSDSSNASKIFIFNLTVFSTEHSPVLMELSSQNSSINRYFYYQINASDTEDGNSSSPGNFNFTFGYAMLSGSDIFNATNFNSTTGIMNITFSSNQGGKYRMNISVNDTGNMKDFADFWIYVYDLPNISYPYLNSSFNLSENTGYNFTFRANHSIGDYLVYKLFIGENGTNTLRQNTTYYGNNTDLIWSFTPNFTDESYGNYKNLTLLVYSSLFPEINSSSVWNIGINHSNAPVTFSGNIGNQQTDFNNDILIPLSDYFSDIDYFDSFYNQTLRINVSSNATPSYIGWAVTDFTLNLTSLIAVKELLNITISDLNGSVVLTNATSNNFEVEFTTPPSVSVPTSSSGGGLSETPVALKIIVTDKVSAYAHQKITVPLRLENRGKRTFSYINLTATAFKDGNPSDKVMAVLDRTYFEHLDRGESENFTLSLFFENNSKGNYEVIVNATSKIPNYEDWAKIHISLQELNDSGNEDFLIFAEEFLAENPECIELKEIVAEARKYYEQGNMDKARLLTDSAIEACREAISQVSLPSLKIKAFFSMNEYVIIVSLVSVFLGFSYYSIKRFLFKRKLNLQTSPSEEAYIYRR
jgi:hypothetical protein